MIHHLEARLSLLRNTGQQLLDLSDGLAGVEALGARLGAVHDGVASKKGKMMKMMMKMMMPIPMTREGPTLPDFFLLHFIFPVRFQSDSY